MPADLVDSRGPLERAVVGALMGLGAQVELGAEENAVRALSLPVGASRTFDLTEDPERHQGPPLALVRVEGLPNLLHEYVHVLLAECLDDDHGIDYGAIPFDLHTVSGRQMLWEELSCCVVSCAYLGRVGTDETLSHMNRRVDAWFAEQVEIQPVFYGMEDVPGAFWRIVRDCMLAHPHEHARVEELAYHRSAAILTWAGAPPSWCEPPSRLRLQDLLDRHARPGGIKD
jgi:hypothetical protein